MPPKRHARAGSTASNRSVRGGSSRTAPVPVLDSVLGQDAAPTTLPTTTEDAGAISTAPAEALAYASQVSDGVGDVLTFVPVALACLVAQAVLNGLMARLPIMRSVAEISRDLSDAPWAVVGLLGWKVLEVAVGWFGGFRDTDMFLFTLLTNFPQTYLLWTFYATPLFPLGLTLISNSLANGLGFRLTRPTPSITKSQTSPTKSPSGLDTSDPILFTVPRLLAAGLYALPMLLSLTTFLPLQLATHFSGLRTLAPAHSATLQGLGATFLILGDCAVRFLLNPILYPPSPIASTKTDEAAKANEMLHFDPATASLSEHLAFNVHNMLFWRHVRPAGREIVKRTALLAAWTIANAAFNACATVEGCEFEARVGSWLAGPLAWGSVWGAGAIATGATMGWVGGVFF